MKRCLQILILLFPAILFAESPPVVMEDGKESYELGLNLDLYEDKTGKLTINDVIKPELLSQFKTSTKKVPNFGFTKSHFWARVKITNPSKVKGDWYLSFNYVLQDRVSFYKKGGVGGEEDFVEGGQWKRRVRAANKAASDVAADLVRDYLGRSQAVSDKYYLDKDIENRLLDGFEFKDTGDQALAWAEIKKDLLSSSPMERLLCGDVGFGKTELAIRACFLSSINGFGSLVLAPTTILCKQLYFSFKQRL